MTNVSVFQPQGGPASWQVTMPPRSYINLKQTATSSASVLPALQHFLEDKERQVLKELRGLQAARVGDFLDEVRKLVVATI